MAVFY